MVKHQPFSFQIPFWLHMPHNINAINRTMCGHLEQKTLKITFPRENSLFYLWPNVVKSSCGRSAAHLLHKFGEKKICALNPPFLFSWIYRNSLTKENNVTQDSQKYTFVHFYLFMVLCCLLQLPPFPFVFPLILFFHSLLACLALPGSKSS